MRSHIACRVQSEMNVGKKGSFVVISSLLAAVLLLAYLKQDCGKVAVARGVRTAKVAPDAGNLQAGKVACKLQSCKLHIIYKVGGGIW